MTTTIHIGPHADNTHNFRVDLTTWAHMREGKPMCYMYNPGANKLQPVYNKEQVRECGGCRVPEEPIEVEQMSYWWNPEWDDDTYSTAKLAVHEFYNEAEKFFVYFIAKDEEELLEYTKWYTLDGTPERVYDFLMSPS